MATPKKPHLTHRYGMCLNDNCPKCKSKEVQQIPARKDFVCPECQKPLKECRPPKSFWDKHGKTIIIGGVVVVVGAAAGFFALRPSQPAEEVEEVQEVEQVAPQVEEADTTATEAADTTAEVPAEETVEEPAVEKPAAPQTPAPAASGSAIKVPFGTYSGPDNGLNGEIKVTRSYSLDLRNAAHETIELQPGDIITHTKFKNGELVSGYWHRGSESRSFHR